MGSNVTWGLCGEAMIENYYRSEQEMGQRVMDQYRSNGSPAVTR